MELINSEDKYYDDSDHIYSWNYSDRYEVKIDEQTVREQKEHFVETVPAVMIEFVSHATAVFQSLMDFDQFSSIEHSTNPYKNLDKIYKNAQADGGSSGQFFFFTYNNLILLKTIT